MATTIGTEAYKLVADTRGFIKGINDAKAAVGGFQSNMSRLVAGAGAIGSLTGAVGGYFAVLDSQAARASQSMAGLADATQILGDTSAEFVQFAKTAEQFNVSLDETTAIAQKMAKTLANGEGRGAIQKLGLDFEKLRRSGAGAMMQQIVQALREVEDVGTRTSILTELGGRGAVSLAEMLTGSQSEWDLATQAASKYAETVKAADIALADYVGTLRKFNEANMSGVGSERANRTALAEEVMLEMSRDRSGLSRELLNSRVGRFFARRVMDTGVLGQMLDPVLYNAVLQREQQVRAQSVLDEAAARFAKKSEVSGTAAADATELRKSLNLDSVSARTAALANLLGQSVGFGIAFSGGAAAAMLQKAQKSAAGFSNIATAYGGAEAFGGGQRASEANRRANELKAATEKTARAAEEQVRQQQQTNRNLEDATAAIRSLGSLIGLVK